jgi:hypothetical protein
MMEKKLTNSGPFMESTGKHSIYTSCEVGSILLSLTATPDCWCALMLRAGRST